MNHKKVSKTKDDWLYIGVNNRTGDHWTRKKSAANG